MAELGDAIDALVPERLSSHDVYFVFSCKDTGHGHNHEPRTDDRASLAFDRLSGALRPFESDLWEDADWTVSKDFLPRARLLFANGQSKIRALNPLALQYANGGPLMRQEPGASLSLKLRRNATSRVGLGLESIPIRVEGLNVIRFASGVALGALRLRYTLDPNWTLTQSAQVILDCNHYIGHPLTHRADGLSWTSATHQDAPRLMGLLRALMAPDGHEPDAAAFQRVFSFTALSTNAARIDTAQHDLLLSRLSRKHTSAYLPGERYAQAFGVLANVRFSAMPEGAALIISTASGSEFSASYLNHSVPQVYLPAVLASAHEHALLRSMEDAVVAMPTQDAEETLAALQRALHKMLQFRVGYRLHAISGIAMHNEFHSRLRNALLLDGSLERLTDDMRLVEQQLGADLHERDEKRRLWLTALGSAAAAFAAVHEFFEICVKLKWDHDIAIGLARLFSDKAFQPGYEYMVSQRHVDEIWGVAVPIVFALLAAWMSWRKKWTLPRH